MRSAQVQSSLFILQKSHAPSDCILVFFTYEVILSNNPFQPQALKTWAQFLLHPDSVQAPPTSDQGTACTVLASHTSPV